MESAQTEELVSVEEYLAGELIAETKHEYLGGVIHAMSGSKAGHNRISGNVYRLLGNALEGKPCEPFNSDMKVRIELPEQTRFYYPDVAVVCDPPDDDESYMDNPVVVFEVLSKSTKRVDTGEKRAAYRAVPSLRVYAMIDPVRLHVTLDRRRENRGFDTELYTDTGQVIPLPEISTELRMDSIYSGVDIPSR